MVWKWTDGEIPGFSNGRNYSMPEEDKVAFAEEAEEWIKEGILVPWSRDEHGDVGNICRL